MAATDVKSIVDQITRQSGYGQLGQAAGNALYGINHRGMGNPIPHNTDNHGLTFFTRPRLNLSYDNLAEDRTLTTLMDNTHNSYPTAIRVLLDPIGAGQSEPSGFLLPNDATAIVKSALVDQFSPFMAILTNNLLSLSGWKDPTLPTFTSHEGIQQESWSMVDGIMRDFTTFDLNATFRNIAGDPITLLFNSWMRYASNVYQGIMMPYPDAIVENEIDYQTRIYRLVLDPSRQFVTKIAATGAAFPIANSLGSAFNYSTDTPFSTDNQEISVPFRCMGADYNDPITIKEFNTIVQIFNIDMVNPTGKGYVKLAKSELQFFNYYGYPLIDPTTFELQWWVQSDDYAAIKNVQLQLASTNR
jgi:hypothetical protein